MIKAGRNKFVHAVFAVCVLMQFTAMLPHHHHEGSEAVCVGYFDPGCEEDCCAGGVCGSGSHGCVAGHGGSCHEPGTGPDGCAKSPCEHHTSEPYGHGHTPAVCSIHTFVIAQPEREDITLTAYAADIHEDPCGVFHDQIGEAFLAGHVTTLLSLEFRRRPHAEPLFTGYISVAHPARGPDMAA